MIKTFFRVPFSKKSWVQKISILMISAIIMFLIVAMISYLISILVKVSNKSGFIINTCTASFTALSAFFVGVQEHEDHRHDLASEHQLKRIMALKAVNVFNDKIVGHIIKVINQIDEYSTNHPTSIKKNIDEAREVVLTNMIIHDKISVESLSKLIFFISKWSMGNLDKFTVDMNIIDAKLRKIIKDFAGPGDIVVYYIRETNSESNYELSGYEKLVNRYKNY